MKAMKKSNAFLKVLDEQELQNVQGGFGVCGKVRFRGPFPLGSVFPACIIAYSFKNSSKSKTPKYTTTWSYRR